MHQPQITVLQPLNHRSYSCHYHIFVGFSSKLIMAFVQRLHGEKGERRERNERVLENIPVDVMVRISIFPKLPCCICLASSAASLFKSSFFKIESRCGVKSTFLVSKLKETGKP
jgi:hypothetical protein